MSSQNWSTEFASDTKAIMENESKNRTLICIGVPGSGKSTFSKSLCRTYPDKWYRISQDDLGTRQACEELFKAKLNEGMNVIIDRCNFNRSQRKVWIELAWSFDVPVDAIIMDTSMEECSSRIIERQNHPTEVQGQKGLEILANFHQWMVFPNYEEGFERIISIKPQPTPDSYNDKVIEEILTKLNKEQIVAHNRSIPITNTGKLNARNEINSRERYNDRGYSRPRNGNLESRNNPWKNTENNSTNHTNRYNDKYQNDFPPLGGS
ncbi:5837_t:CDS:2 [Cetraspora pellucida]|uniref:5837_t:CDS:1 n=1 Tax=Cetraspora pellucida TaxID=1433469 RepID=A0A9N8YT37_9GLOM|nr:5837_t:CDS:2 [Cetraspora pellucida]